MNDPLYKFNRSKLVEEMKVCHVTRDEFLKQRNEARQWAYTLSEYVKSQPIGSNFPKQVIDQIDRSRGVGGYQWPERTR